ncbi:TPA: FecR domain-containing protein [Klebsiella michiganensis]|nr:FecR domain-containing protein [Klebsiella michiganensis]
MKLTSRTDIVAKQAIEWMVLLRSGVATDEDFQQFERWRYSDAKHDAACSKIEATLGKIQTLSQDQTVESVRQPLLAPSSRRRFLQGSLCFAVVAVSSGFVANQKYPLHYMLSDAYTSTGQRRRIDLNDSSSLEMNARTALNYSIDDNLRQVDLFTGGIIAQIVKDERPFGVNTPEGRILASEACFHVRGEAGGTHLAVLESVVKVTNMRGASKLVKAGEGLWFDHESMIPVAISTYAETAWTQGRLEVKDATLQSVISSLRNYTQAVIRLDSSVAYLRVSGNFPLDDVPYTLDSLAQTMPIAITSTTGYWIHITAAEV